MTATTALLSQFWNSLGGELSDTHHVLFSGAGALSCAFAVTDFAAASIGTAGLAVAELLALRHGDFPSVRVDSRLSSLWFGTSLRPRGWTLPSPWDPIAGDYRASDGWIRLHTNAPEHRAAALSVLAVQAEKEAVAKAVSEWNAQDLETAIVERGGCAAVMRSQAEWGAHPQGRAVSAEPLFHVSLAGSGKRPAWPICADRPLRGIRVLDLTRVLAGPVATRFLAGLGADVLRIDPPWWNEPGLVPEVTLGKRCARLDLRDPMQRARFDALLGQADVLVHGYRSDALDRLGLGAAHRRTLRPELIDVSLDAYGWTGPWARRRGFDSLVQMSCGIADTGMRNFGRDRPTPLPVQALDHATGYLMAAAVVRGITRRLQDGSGLEARTSLARMACALMDHPASPDLQPIASQDPTDLVSGLEQTAWGPAQRLRAPVSISGAPLIWDTPAVALGSSEPVW